MGPNAFGAGGGGGREERVAVFRVRVPTQRGYTTTVTASTCGPATAVGTRLSAYGACPDPWAALAGAC